MGIEVGKRYRIDPEHIAEDGSCHGIWGSIMEERYPGGVIKVDDIEGRLIIFDGYALRREWLLPLLEEGMKVKISRDCIDDDIYEQDYDKTYPDGVGVIDQFEDDGIHGVEGEYTSYYIHEEYLTPITDNVKTEAKEEEMAESKLEKDIRLLKEAEKKWVGVVYDGKEDHGNEDCPLCIEYDNACSDCPIGNSYRPIEWQK